MSATAELAENIKRGERLRDDGQLEAAAAFFEALLASSPDDALVHYKLGTVYGRMSDRNEAAEASYRRALELDPAYAEAAHNLALLLAARQEFHEAEPLYRLALAEKPCYFEAHVNLGNVLWETSRIVESIYHFRRAGELRPDSALPHERLGQVLRRHGREFEAVKELEAAVAIDPKFASAWNNLGTCHLDLAHHELADRAFKAAIDVSDDFVAPWTNYLLVANYQVMDRREVFERHRRFGEFARRACGEPQFGYATTADPERPLRIGFMSGDLRTHSVAYFVKGVLDHLDRSRFQLHAYATHRSEDDMTRRLRHMFFGWHQVSHLSDEQIVERIRGDRIDILIDLAGHTSHSRPLALARKPAPLLISWAGYPNSTGLDCVDYRLADALVDPQGSDDFYSERLWRLPECFLCYSPPEAAPEPVPPPSATGRPLTFGSFNTRVKLGDPCIALWARVLAALPESRLVLKSVLGLGTGESRQALLDQFAAHGVAAERITLLPTRGDVVEHLASYGEMDIALDSFPYHGTTTTCEALWMGVPVVTLAGDRHVSRVGVSLLTNAGLPDLVAADEDEFVAIACALAGSSETLAGLRSGLRIQLRQSTLLDGRRFAGHLGEAWREMWREHCRCGAAMHAPAAAPTGESGLIRLHIGGMVTAPGWKILDIEDRPEVDYVGDIRDLSALADESCSEVYCSHVLEHVGQTEMVEVLREVYRIMTPGGTLYLAVPDLDVLAWLFRRPGYGPAQRFHLMQIMFGGQTNKYDFHFIGLNFEFMSDYLRDVGFAEVRRVESFGLFGDASEAWFDGVRVSLNLVVTK